ncbi:MAG: DUF1015 domain-containing protein [Sedimentisphaerales bacterium]|nr:DUF1015 domain-containing protein [Sedimentisphaerales bacterium]
MQIKPFKAFRFNPAVVGDVGNCIAPPYDVISEDARFQLLEKSRYNIVRVIKSTPGPMPVVYKAAQLSNGDVESAPEKPEKSKEVDQYKRAAGYLAQWIDQGALKQDKEEAIYAYVQEFKIGNETFQRHSFIALGKLEEFGKIVKPHEQILAKPIVDRYNLKKATLADLGLVFMLYEDEKQVAEKIIEKTAQGDPLIDYTDEMDVRHQLFNISNGKELKEITSMMKDKSCVIADGHHRYTTGLKFAKDTDNPNAKYQMLAFANTSQKGLIILATHRVVQNLKNFNLQKLIEGLKKRFEITEYKFNNPQTQMQAKEKMLEHMKTEVSLEKCAFGIYGGNDKFYIAVLTDTDAINHAAADMSPAWRTLDLAILHKLILEELLGIDQEVLSRGENLQYVKDTPNAIDDTIYDIESGDKQVAFFTNAVTIKQLHMVTDAGERMPQKATYFFPKLYSGLTINKL